MMAASTPSMRPWSTTYGVFVASQWIRATPFSSTEPRLMPKSSMERLTLLHRHVRVLVDVAATWVGIDRAFFPEWLERELESSAVEQAVD
jgi:hypothetical protein